MDRHARLRRIEQLDPVVDAAGIHRTSVTREFPWDYDRALSFALFRTCAVPAVGRLLHGTGELTRRTQERYDDTVLLLDAVLEHGFDGRGPARRSGA